MSGVRGGDVEILANKLATAQHFTSVVASRGVPYGQDQLSTVKGIMSDITSSASSLAIAKAALEDYIFTLDPNYDIDVANFTSKEILDVVNIRVNFPTDDDIYTYRLDAGIEYIFEFSGVNDSNNSLTEPWLGVYDSDGTWLETNSNVNQVNRIFFTPPHTTDYHISVRSLDSTEIGAYSLLSDWVGKDTIIDNIDSSETLKAGEQLVNHIDFIGDEDWFHIELIADTQYRFHLKGIGSESGSLSNSSLAIFHQSGISLASDDNSGSGLDSMFSFTPQISGSYYLAASGENTGTYTLDTNISAFNITSASVVFEDPDGAFAGYEKIIEENVLTAWSLWDQYIDAHPKSDIEISIRVFENPKRENILALGGFLTSTLDSNGLREGGVQYELLRGEDINGISSDAKISISLPHLYEQDYYDFSLDNFTPSDQISFLNVMTHELGHALGFIGWWDDDATNSIYESLVDDENALFIGKYSIAVNGAPIELYSEEKGHLSSSHFSNSIMKELITGGDSEEITEIEIVILADLGLPIYDQYL